MATKQEKGSTLIEAIQHNVIEEIMRDEIKIVIGKTKRSISNSPNCFSSFYKLSLLILTCFLFISCSNSKSPEQSVIIVKVPPLYDNKISREENYWRFQSFLFPQQKVPNPIPKGLPNDDSLFFVIIDESGKVTLNAQVAGSVSETRFLTAQLSAFFQERKEVGVYEPGNWKIVKAVGIKTAHSIKYGDFIKVAAAVEQSGAEPIVLLFDDDARPKFKTNLETEK